MQDQQKKFRRNVAVVVLDDQGLILACERSDVKGAWQLPQGGIEEGESDEAAMKRELKEEIGTDDISIIGRLKDPIRYDWPEKLYSRGYHGQEQIYFLVRLKNTKSINLHSWGEVEVEFSSVEWVGKNEFLSRISGFKTAAYTEALEKLSAAFPNLMKD